MFSTILKGNVKHLHIQHDLKVSQSFLHIYGNYILDY